MLQKAVILAGGKGTRLGVISEKIPKPLQPVAGISVLHHQIKLLAHYGIQEIYVITNYLYEKITHSVTEIKEQVSAKIIIHRESKELGTVGGIKEIERLLDGDFMVLYGDIMLDIDLQRLVNFHIRKKADATLVVHPTDHPKDSDLLEVDAFDKITAFHSKHNRNPTETFPNISNAGLYIFSPIIFPFLSKGEKADFGKDIFPNIYKKLKLFAYNTPEYLKDMGTPDRIEKVRRDFANGIIQAKNLKNKQKAIFIDRDGVLNELNGYISKPQQLSIFENAIEAVKKINDSVYLAIVITNQPVVARGLCSIEELHKIHQKLAYVLGNSGAKLDAIYFCPHHPDRGFEGENIDYKKECACRKPNTGMVEAAAEKFNIDLEASYFIGDTWRDIECGANANTKTVLVGKSEKDEKIRPTYRAENLLAAVQKILS